jgi:hypothetical protein
MGNLEYKDMRSFRYEEFLRKGEFKGKDNNEEFLRWSLWVCFDFLRIGTFNEELSEGS